MENWKSSSLEYLDLSSNFFSEKFPLGITHLKSLIHIKIRNCSLRGSLPSSVFEPFTVLSTIDLSANKFTGTLPISLFLSSNLKEIQLSGNFFDGRIPNIDGEAVVNNSSTSLPRFNLEILDLSDNSLFGALPSGIIYLQKLKSLHLRSNSLSGSIPTGIVTLESLEYLDLSSNKLQGLIPNISQSTLMMLNLSYNNLSGDIPKNLAEFPDSCFYPGNHFLYHHSPDTTSPASVSSTYSDISGIYSTDQVERKKRRRGIAIALICFCVVTIIVVLVGISLHVFQHFKKKNEISEISKDLSLSKKPSKYHKYDHVKNIHNESDLLPPIYSSDQLVGRLCFFNNHSPTIMFPVNELSNAPAQVVGRGSHGTSYKVILKNGHILIAKRFRIGLSKPTKDFAKEIKRIGSISHQNIIPLRAHYYGSNYQENILLSDYIDGNSLAWYLHGSGRLLFIIKVYVFMIYFQFTLMIYY